MIMKYRIALAFLSFEAIVTSAARSSGARPSSHTAAPLDAQAGSARRVRELAAPGPPVALPLAGGAAKVLPTSQPLPTVTHRKLPGQGYGEWPPARRTPEPRERAPTLQGAGEDGAGREEAAAAPAPATVWACWQRYPSAVLLSNLVYVLLVVSGGCIYQKSAKHASRELADGDESMDPSGAFNLGGCREHYDIFLLSLFCPVVRWAATVSGRTVHLMSFWAALSVMLGLSVLSLSLWLTPSLMVLWGNPPGFAAVLCSALALGIAQSLGAWTALLLALALLGLLGPLAFACAGLLLGLGVATGVVCRQRLRRALGHNPAKRKTLNLDVMAWCCCLCCVLSQEARVVESAAPEAPPPGGGAERAPAAR
mmetsp:Transcript_51956/g.150948  ORF Transcript_51956/g.150948 Transcript_51956/m.150948 type:complete len:368 (-) Transcript_51956:9-1112(-)